MYGTVSFFNVLAAIFIFAMFMCLLDDQIYPTVFARLTALANLLRPQREPQMQAMEILYIYGNRAIRTTEQQLPQADGVIRFTVDVEGVHWLLNFHEYAFDLPGEDGEDDESYESYDCNDETEEMPRTPQLLETF